MTYDVLEKVSKKELIAWLRRNVCLPRNISDEEFLRQVKVKRLFAEQKVLLDRSKDINRQLDDAKDNPREFMRLMVEASKLNDRIDQLRDQFDKLMPRGLMYDT